jgi:predicted RNA methylase
LPPGAGLASAPSVRHPASTQGTSSIAQLTANISLPTPGLRAFLDQSHAQAARRTGVAVDFGCGGGRDTRALISAGWTKVHAVDRDPCTVDALRDVTLDESAIVHVSTCTMPKSRQDRQMS